MRLGLLGGTFNPPHIGHLVCAAEACDQLGLDEMASARFVLHVICPRLEYCDRGKSTISAPPELASAVSDVIHRVARPFALREDTHRRQ